MNPNPSGDIWSVPKRGINCEVDDMQAGESGDTLNNDQNPPNPQNPQAPEARTPTHSDGYSIIPPNESRRSKLQRMAEKELDDLNKWKEAHRPGPVHLAPEKLGGSVSLAEVRQRQQVEARQSKLQKKLKREDMDRIRKQAEEEENQRKKAIQREKANNLELRKRQEEEQRKELYQHDLRMRREEQLQRLERSSSVPMAASNSTPASSWAQGREYKEARKAEEQDALEQMKEQQRRKSEILEKKQKQQEEDRKRRMESECLRVNSAFLDRLEARGSGRVSESNSCIPEGGNIWQTEEPQDPASSPVPFPSQVHTDSAEEEEDTDYEWTVMRLQSNFPYYKRELLEDIVSQCNGNYQRAYDLLNV
ncbi:epithelial-stromal interaction protein 1 isoform X2 [Colossoma macropomum]|uniref:epithelial-stromal interaction protein 1 isoform X2 n=1 Tax=Colossoma macropomum TaxID=42526 RepID=UPI001864D2D8|nr:epithelial-stromal interaction protein 1 isoform X2 [Colossoma macropomum]